MFMLSMNAEEGVGTEENVSPVSFQVSGVRCQVAEDSGPKAEGGASVGQCARAESERNAGLRPGKIGTSVRRYVGASWLLRIRILRLPRPARHERGTFFRDAGAKKIRQVKTCGYGSSAIRAEISDSTRRGITLIRYDESRQSNGYSAHSRHIASIRRSDRK